MVREVTKAMFSKGCDEWSTPQYLFDKLNAQYDFTCDVCATPENAKCDYYFTKEDNALLQGWYGRCWMNPPYGREIKNFMRKAYEAVHLEGTAEIVVCLVPARTDTEWWHEYAMFGEIEFIRGRLKFNNSKQPAPFPSAIVVFRRHQSSPHYISYGAV